MVKKQVMLFPYLKLLLGTRASAKQYFAIQKKIDIAEYNETSQIVKAVFTPVEKKGLVAVCCAGTSDIPVAEEAAQTAEFHGSNVIRIYDVGIAGIHRLLSRIDIIRSANCIVAVAGMEGALGIWYIFSRCFRTFNNVKFLCGRHGSGEY